MQLTIDSVGQSLRTVALFQHLPDLELEGLIAHVDQRAYARGQLIFSEGDPGDGLYIVRAGHVGISRLNPEGDELLLAMYEPGEYFGELALFDRGPRSATATAVDDCSLLFLSRESFRHLLEEHVDALFQCVEVIVREFRRLTDVTDEIALMDVRRRLARRLLHLARQGMVSTGPAAPRPAGAIRITQQHLANMTGTTRESINKHLHTLASEGIVYLDRKGVRILDEARLQAVSEGLI